MCSLLSDEQRELLRAGLTRGLSRRRLQLLDGLRQGKTNKEMASELNLTVGTVKQYLSRLYCALHIENRTAMAVWAERHPTFTAHKRLA